MKLIFKHIISYNITSPCFIDFVLKYILYWKMITNGSRQLIYVMTQQMKFDTIHRSTFMIRLLIEINAIVSQFIIICQVMTVFSKKSNHFSSADSDGIIVLVYSFIPSIVLVHDFFFSRFFSLVSSFIRMILLHI